MLDIKSDIILNFLNNECSSGYKVIETTDILTSLGGKNKVDVSYVEQIMKHLDNYGYVSIKYFDENVYCVSMLPFGRQYIEQKENEKEKINKSKKIIINCFIIISIICLISTFIGNLIFYLIF